MFDDLQTPPHAPPPTRLEWLLVAINIVFVVMGLLILPHDRDTGIVTLALFGSCLVSSTATILRKRRYRSFAAEKVDVIGGVPIYPKTEVMRLLGGWLLILGIILIVFGHDYPTYFRCLSGFIAAVGAVVLGGALSGLWPGGHLQFDPDFLTIAQRKWRARIPWDEITDVYQGEYHSNPVLLITVANAAHLDVMPPEESARAMKAIAQSQALLGADIAIMTLHYGIELPVLGATVARYVQDASARAELSPRLAYPSVTDGRD
jgi:hypothetical protein